MNKYEMKQAETITQSLNELPTAEMYDVMSTPKIRAEGQPQEFEYVPDFKLVRVTEHDGKVSYVNATRKRYNLIQHKDAFRPIVDALTVAGVQQFNYVMTSTPAKANMQIYTGQQGVDGVNIGINVESGYNGTSLKYGMDLNEEKNYIEVVGYRQVCSNGMKVRVPIADAEFIREENVTKVKELLSQSFKIVHTVSANVKIEAVKYVVEALAYLKPAVDEIIKRAMKFELRDQEKLKALVELHVGKRFSGRVMSQYEYEDNTIWGLYNAMTHVASHDSELKDSSSETLINKASKMLMVELKN